MILQAKNLTLQYPGKILCRELSWTINPGECWAVLGENGCGKTTLIHAMGGLQKADTGEAPQVSLAGKTPQAWRPRELARHIGVLLQEEPGEFWGDVHEYVLLGRYPHVKGIFGWEAADHEMATRAIECMGLGGLAHRPLTTLSGGERQRARIALLLAQSPQCFLLDEPLQHLDLRHQLSVMTLFRDLATQGKAAVMVLHDIGWASRFCDHILMLFNNGRTLAGRTEEVLNRNDLETLYHCGMTEFIMRGTRHFMPDTTRGV